MTWWRATVALAAVSILGLAGPVTAQEHTQEFGRRAPAERPAPELRLEPTWPAEEKGAREQEFYPGTNVRSVHAPAFVEPLATDVPMSRTTRGRVGVSGWTAPALPYDFPDATGGVAFGLTFTWGTPVPEAAAPQPPSTSDR